MNSGNAQDNTRADMLVKPAWVQEHLDDPSVRILECTTYLEPQPVGPSKVRSGRPDYMAGHIPNAAHVCMVDDLSDPDGEFPYTMPGAGQVERLMSRLGIGNEHHVVLYARGYPHAATRVWYVLRTHGHRRLSIMDGGFERWQREGRPVSREVPAFPVTRYCSAFDARKVAGRDEVQRWAGGEAGGVLVNALSRAQYSGTGGAHYGRPGRIANSSSCPSSELIEREANCYVDDATLRRKLAEAGVTADRRVVAYCGGGIAACGVAFALDLAGHPDWAVYDNSLLEWSNVPDLPMETG